MKLNDKVIYSGSHTELFELGFGDRECTWLLHCWGTVVEVIDDMICVSFKDNGPPGYRPVMVWLNKNMFEMYNQGLTYSVQYEILPTSKESEADASNN